MLKSLNDLSPDVLTEIENLAALFFTPAEIGLMMQLDKKEVAASMVLENHKFYIAFQTGRLQSEVKLRTSIIKLAVAGSSPAQTMAMDLLTKSNIKMINRS